MVTKNKELVQKIKDIKCQQSMLKDLRRQQQDATKKIRQHRLVKQNRKAALALREQKAAISEAAEILLQSAEPSEEQFTGFDGADAAGKKWMLTS